MVRAERHIGGEVDQEYYVHTPSLVVRRNIPYPVQIGVFDYPAGSYIDRDQFDSFLIMVVLEGSFDIRVSGFHGTAEAGEIIILDCYAPHRYEARESSRAIWLHCDGPSVRFYYDRIVSKLGNVFALNDSSDVLKTLHAIHHAFASGGSLSEMELSRNIVDLLTEFALAAECCPVADLRGGGVREVMGYIRLHIDERLTLTDLAALVPCSERTLSRMFQRETGYTVHAYVMEARLNAVKSRLLNTGDSLQQLCDTCGFSSPVALCAAFRHAVGMSPMEYRARGRARSSAGVTGLS